MSKAKSGPGGHDSDLQSASEQGFSILPAKGMIAGETLQQLTQDWWKWIANSPADTSPIMDETGEWAGVNNDGSVFFLAGSFVGDVTRDITVEAGTPILVPILNQLTFQNIGPADPSTDPTTPAQKGLANQWQAEWQKSVSDLFLEVDGVAVKNLQSDLVRTSWFGGEIKAGSLFESFGYTGDLASANSAGYWSVIDNLSVGDHTLHFGGTAGNYSADVTVNLTVV